MSDDRLVFLHFEKTGGTTVHVNLTSAFSGNELCPERGKAITLYSAGELSQYRLFSLHASVAEIWHIPGPYKVISFLREPSSRIVSLYNYLRSHSARVVEDEGLYQAKLVRGKTLAQVLDPEATPSVSEFRNIYTYRLAGDAHYSPSGHPWRSEAELLDAALVNLERLSFVGISEYMEVSFAEMQKALGINIPYGGERYNETATNHLVDPKRFEPVAQLELDGLTLDRLEMASRLDNFIYNSAKERFIDKFKSIVATAPKLPTELQDPLSGERKFLSRGIAQPVLYGQYLDLPPGRYTASVSLRRTHPVRRLDRTSFTIDVCTDRGKNVTARRSVGTSELSEHWARQFFIDFVVAPRERQVEVRICSDDGCFIAVDADTEILRVQ